MKLQHRELAAGRWAQMSLAEQMANIGSEVERALTWRAKNNATYSLRAAERALELFDLSLGAGQGFPRLKEMARMRETVADYFYGANDYSSTEISLKGYFSPFTYAARR